MKTKRKILWKILKIWLLPAFFIMVAATLPFALICLVPFNKLPFPSLALPLRISFTYGFLPMMSLALESSTKMPAYLGFFVSKAISMLWQLLKLKNFVPTIPFETQATYALLTGLIGFVSVKQSRSKELEEAEEENSKERQSPEGGPTHYYNSEGEGETPMLIKAD